LFFGLALLFVLVVQIVTSSTEDSKGDGLDARTNLIWQSADTHLQSSEALAATATLKN